MSTHHIFGDMLDAHDFAYAERRGVSAEQLAALWCITEKYLREQLGYTTDEAREASTYAIRVTVSKELPPERPGTEGHIHSGCLEPLLRTLVPYYCEFMELGQRQIELEMLGSVAAHIRECDECGAELTDMVLLYHEQLPKRDTSSVMVN